MSAPIIIAFPRLKTRVAQEKIDDVQAQPVVGSYEAPWELRNEY